MSTREVRTILIALAIVLIIRCSGGCGGGSSNNSSSAPSEGEGSNNPSPPPSGGEGSNILSVPPSGGEGSNNPSFPSNCPLGSARVSWDPVTTYTDGTIIYIVDYRIYYRKEDSNKFTEDNSVYLNNPGSNTAYLFSNLESGTYYFAVSAIDPYFGIESDFSDENMKSIP